MAQDFESLKHVSGVIIASALLVLNGAGTAHAQQADDALPPGLMEDIESLVPSDVILPEDPNATPNFDPPAPRANTPFILLPEPPAPPVAEATPEAAPVAVETTDTATDTAASEGEASSFDEVIIPGQVSKVVCPIGGEVFEFERLPVLEADGVRLDFRAVRDDGKLVQPLPVPVCPGNGLPVYNIDFKPEVLKKIEAFMQTPEWTELRDNHGDFYVISRLIRDFDSQDDQNGVMTFALLAAAWEIEGVEGYEDRFNAYYSEALTYLDKVLEQTSFDEPQEYWGLALLGVDIARRTGDFQDAANRLARLEFASQPDNARIRLTYAYEQQLIAQQDKGAYMIRSPKPEQQQSTE
ncbi:MAG: hypothetical protein Alpg2KO_15100 [Alphaproteobacteria bacterium]